MRTEANGLRGVPWQLSSRTSTLRPDGRPVDILHDFYIPALQRSVRYDRVAGYFRSTSLAASDHRGAAADRHLAPAAYRYLLCDEVGLGKTIEAGLAIRSLSLSGLAQRVLIGAPASLTMQWQREMASKFLLPFGRALGGTPTRHAYLFPGAEERSAHSVYAPDLVIVSTG